MKKTAVLVLFLLICSPLFSQSEDFPFLMYDFGGGYAIGAQPGDMGFFDLSMRFPFGRLGLTAQAGGLFGGESPMFRLFFGPTLYVVNTRQWRLMADLGLDMMLEKSYWLGLGVYFGVHRILSKNLYAGIGIGAVYVFDHVYKEITGYSSQKVIEQNPNSPNYGQIVTKVTPIEENRDHFINRFLFKPSVVFGWQF